MGASADNGATSAGIVRTGCPRDCPDVCGMLAHVADGRVTKVVGDPDHPVTRGFICAKCRGYETWIHHPERLTTPLVRDRKGGELRPADWDEALDRVAGRFAAIMAEHGGEAILPYSYLGHMGIVSSRFPDRLWNRMNTPRVGAEICAMAGAEAMLRLVGRVRGTEPQHLSRTRLYVAWGKHPKAPNVHLWSLIRDVPIKVVVDPFESDSARDADLHIRPRPGTDSMLVLGLMRVFLDNGWIDRDYIRRHTTGYESLAERVRGVSLDAVERVTGVPRDRVISLARLYHENRPGLLHIGVGLQRNVNGGEMVGAVAMLAALTGQIGVRGGGVLYANYDWRLNDISYGHLRSDGPRMYNMVKLGRYLTEDDHLKALYVYNQNPAATCPNQRLVRRGLAREDLFVVVHDLFLTDTARYADVVLPATSFAETRDLQLSYWHDYVQINNPAIPPLGGARSNRWVISELARRLGFDEPCFRQTDEDVIREALEGTGLDYEALTAGPVLWNDAERTSFDDGVFPTPSGRIELYPFDCTPCPDEGHPYRFITPKTMRLQGSQYGNMPDKLGDQATPWLYLHPDDAAREGITDGGPVRVWNGRGEVTLIARVSERVQPGLVVSYMVRWGDNANATTPDRGADLAGNSTFHSNYVSVAPVAAS